MQQAGGFHQAPFGLVEITKQRLDKPIEAFAKPRKAGVFRLGEIASLDQWISVVWFFRHLCKQQNFAQCVTRDGNAIFIARNIVPTELPLVIMINGFFIFCTNHQIVRTRAQKEFLIKRL